jgi:hypothetical protein
MVCPRKSVWNCCMVCKGFLLELFIAS